MITEEEYQKALEIIREYNPDKFVKVNHIPHIRDIDYDLAYIAPIKSNDEGKSYLQLISPNGEIIPCNIFIRLHEGCNEELTAVCKFKVKLGEVKNDN